MESYIKSNEHDEVKELRRIPRHITRERCFGQLDNIHGSTAKVSNINKTKNKHTLIRG